ncbi:hypothetical protein F5144DRAFT_121142 [Chaetomium tenue]|uniref:Uncharacterized protein n=1 Tax=Chaetomium tenue TaxID=1854479 RepID=A0ACB7PJ18_9PEZI|nr:hypothetical protein F5144DRAFT_121142 [Chaetomium globosum]
MAPSTILASALALQAIAGAYAAPGTKLNTRAVRPDEPPVFDAKPFPTNGTEEPYIPPHVDSPHFRLFLGPASETGAAEGLQPLEAAYDCFVGVLGWNSTGLSIRNPSEPYWKTEIFMQAEMAGGFSGLAHYSMDTGRAWVQLLDGVLTAPGLTVHELGHVLHFHQDNSFWGGMVNAQAWAEAVANWVADTYLTSDLCAASRAKHNQPIGETVFHIYRTVGDSHLTIVDATNMQIGNHYDAWPFFHYLVLNPDNWHGLGRDAMLTLIRSTPAGAPDETPLHVLERVLDGTATVREVVARYWARMAYVDVAHPQALRAFEENKAFLHKSNFDKVEEGRYRVKSERAPRYMGASMAALVPVSDDGAGTVAVNVTAAEAGASLVVTVAVRDTVSGSVRYVGLDGGAGSVDIVAGEEATLVVVNAPEALLKYDGNNLAGSEANKGLDYSFTVIGATVSMY